jgi:hypothetical protein
MDVLDKFFTKYSYKFPKGYPDLKDKQDILLLESILEELGLNLILENQELISLINNSGLFKDYGEIDVSGKDTIKLKFSEIPSVGKNSVSLRNEVYDLLKQLVDKEELLSDYNRDMIKGSSIGSTTLKLRDKPIRIIVKGGSTGTNPWKTDTDEKEGLVVVLFNVMKAGGDLKVFNKENFNDNILIINDTQNKYEGLDDKAASKVKEYLNKINEGADFDNPDKMLLSSLNNPFSISNYLNSSPYSDGILIRNKLFDTIRANCSQILGIKADKWNPGDIYIQIGSVNLPDSKEIQDWNDLFVNNWGDTDAPLVSISLKEESYQPGRSKSYLEKFLVDPKNLEYNLTSEEFDYNEDQYKEKIKTLRDQIQKVDQGVKLEGSGFTNDEMPTNLKVLRAKYGAYKLLTFLYNNYKDTDGKQNLRDALLKLFSFGLSMSGNNPTYFKLIGKNSGGSPGVEKTSAGAYGEFIDDPVIKDTPGQGGFYMSGNLNIVKGDEKEKRTIKQQMRTSGSGQVQIV